MTALEMQRYYLNEAKKFYGQPGRGSAEARDILDRWEYVLNCLDQNPELLYRDVDWIAKRDLLLEAVQGEMTLDDVRKLQGWADEIRGASLQIDALAALDDKEISQHLQGVLPARTWVTLGHHLEYNELTWQGFMKQVQLPWQLQKIDMKYHEVSEDGYFYRHAASRDDQPRQHGRRGGARPDAGAIRDTSIHSGLAGAPLCHRQRGGQPDLVGVPGAVDARQV